MSSQKLLKLSHFISYGSPNINLQLFVIGTSINLNTLFTFCNKQTNQYHENSRNFSSSDSQKIINWHFTKSPQLEFFCRAFFIKFFPPLPAHLPVLTRPIYMYLFYVMRVLDILCATVLRISFINYKCNKLQLRVY